MNPALTLRVRALFFTASLRFTLGCAWQEIPVVAAQFVAGQACSTADAYGEERQVGSGEFD
jgi:hypothetical protein